jgi:hypothetical protein
MRLNDNLQKNIAKSAINVYNGERAIEPLVQAVFAEIVKNPSKICSKKI